MDMGVQGESHHTVILQAEDQTENGCDEAHTGSGKACEPTGEDRDDDYQYEGAVNPAHCASNHSNTRVRRRVFRLGSGVSVTVTVISQGLLSRERKRPGAI